jgi:hypothetical protein
MLFHITDDQALLAAIGAVTLRHSQLDYALRMPIKTLVEVGIGEAMDATAFSLSCFEFAPT